VGLKLLAEEKMDPSLMKLELLLEKEMFESLVKLELLLEEKNPRSLVHQCFLCKYQVEGKC
jgi:hypothetical protein